MLHCLTEVDDDHTCVLPKDHDGPHVPTSDSDIIVKFVPPDSVEIEVRDET